MGKGYEFVLFFVGGQLSFLLEFVGLAFFFWHVFEEKVVLGVAAVVWLFCRAFFALVMVELACFSVLCGADQLVLPYCNFFLDFELRFFEVIYPISRQFVQLFVFVQYIHFCLFFQAFRILVSVSFETVAIISHVLVAACVVNQLLEVLSIDHLGDLYLFFHYC